ncbi:hypothetical protein D3C85_1791250 [compost metagenome]
MRFCAVIITACTAQGPATAQSGVAPSNNAHRPRISRQTKISFWPSMALTISSTLISSAGLASLNPPRTPSVATTSFALASRVKIFAR